MQLTWKWVLGAAAALLLMRIGGLIGNFWTALGVLGFLVILGLLQLLPAFRRFAMFVFLGWLAVFVLLPAVTSGVARLPILGPALDRRAIDTELRKAEWSDPIAYRARIGLHRYCQEVDQLQGEWLDRQLQVARRALEPPPRPGLLARIGMALGWMREPQWGFPKPPATIKEQKVADWLATIEAHRLECRALVLRAVPKPPVPPEGKGWFERVYAALTANPRLTVAGIVLALAAVMVLILIIRLFQGKPVGGIAAGIALLLIAWLIADRFILERRLAPPAVAVAKPAEIRQLEIPLKGPSERVPVEEPLPPWRYKIDQRSVRGTLHIEFTDGRQDTLDPGEKKNFGATRYPTKFRGEGTVLLWLCPPPHGALCGDNS